MMHKIQYILCMLLIIVVIFLQTTETYADDVDEEEWKENQIQQIVVETVGEVVEEPVIHSRAAVIYDRETKQILWGKKEKEKRAMASTTKIMTAIVVLEKTQLSDIVTVSKKAANTGGSVLHINTGDKITVLHLLYGLLLRSGNDAAVALAEYVGGNIEGFADLMNKKAKELNLENTHFVTPHGLDNENHYTTAYELAILTDYALQNETFKKIVNSKTATILVNGVSRLIYNTNELLGNLTGVDGVKTGFTGNAGRCLVTSTTRNGKQIIVVVLGADTKQQRTQDSIKLIEYAFKNFETINLKTKIEKEFEKWKQINQNRIYIYKAKNKPIELQLEKFKKEKITIIKGEENQVEIQFHCIYQYEAPMQENRKIGNIIVKYKEQIIDQIDIQLKYGVERKGVWEYIQEFLAVLP